MTTPLAGVRVLELSAGTDYAVPYATRLLADLGADVILVEDPAGHPLRSGGGTTDDPAVAEAMFATLTSGKRSLSLRLEGNDSVLAGLIASVDVVVDGLGNDRLAELGFDDERLRGLRADSTVVHVSPWGATGPYRDLPATDLVLQAAAGWISTRQEPGLPFVQVGGLMHHWVAGSYIAMSVLTARSWTQRSGEGVITDFSMFECIHGTIPYTRLMLDTNTELGLGPRAVVFTPFGVRPCLDGWVGINILTGQQWVDACLLTELVDFTDQQQELGRGEGDTAGFEARLIEWLSDKTVNEVVDLGQALRIPVVPVADGASIATLPQWAEREFFVEVPGATADSGFVRPGPPWRLSRTPALRNRPAPAAGAHTSAITDELRLPVGDLR